MSHNFPVKLNIRIDWSELDLFGHVNNVMFMKYVQASRVNYWEHTGLYQTFLKNKIGPLLANTSCAFKKPLYYPGDIVIKASIEFIKTTSFGIIHHIMDHTGELAAEAHDVIVLFDFNKNEKVVIPEEFRSMIHKLEGRTV